MKDKDRVILGKVILYLNDIRAYAHGMSFQEFENDKKTVNACAFLFSQIGELVKKLSDEFLESYAETPWHNIRGLRNRIIHEYESIDLNMLWYAITDDVEDFEKNLIGILHGDNQKTSKN